MVVILHSLAQYVEQLCARSKEAPSLEHVRPKHCVFCGAIAYNHEGILQIIGHGMYARQVRGLCAKEWLVIWIRRFLCLACGHTMSRLPDCLLPWRWYAGPVIMEALYRHCVLGETARCIGILFGRTEYETEWRSLRRWRYQLLVSPTLWGWLGPRLGVTQPAANRVEGQSYLLRLLAEGGQKVLSGVEALEELHTTARRLVQDLVHDRKEAWRFDQFPPGSRQTPPPSPLSRGLPTEEDSGRSPPPRT